MPTPKIPATVRRFYGSNAIVQLADGVEQSAQTSSRNKSLVCGDRVLMEMRAGDFYIVETEQRETEFFRTDGFGRRKIIAANVDQIILVIAPQPSPHMHVIDRYWVAARNCSIPMALLMNKSDLVFDGLLLEIEAVYKKIGLEIHCSSTKSGSGIEAVRKLLAGKSSVFVGQSGVGKSSIVNSLRGNEKIQTGGLSERRDEGRHTTTTSDFYDIGDDARIIDSPGIREFGLNHYDQRSLESGFIEIEEASECCRFRDCVHQRTPGCGVEAAVKNGKIDERRLESYRQLLALIS